MATPFDQYEEQSEVDFVFVCRWLASSGVECGHSCLSSEELTAHLRGNHIGDGQSCRWGPCHYVTDDLGCLTRHVLFHSYLAYLKNEGLACQSKHQLPDCQLDEDAEDDVGDVEVMVCLWWSSEAECGREFDCPMEYHSHVREHVIAMKEPKCCWRDCPNGRKSRTKLLEHMRTHTQEKVAACSSCGAVFSSNSKFKDHLGRQATPTNHAHTCCICNKQFATERFLRQHVKRHVNTQRCPHCDMTCSSPSGLWQHIVYKHTHSRPHRCFVCDKTFKTQTALTNHLDTHQDHCVACPESGCTYVGKSVRAWQQHMRTNHVGPEPQFCCHVCSERYAQGIQLTSHLKTAHGFTLPPGHSRFRYIAGPDGLKRLQTVRLDDNSIVSKQT